jgi:Uncharacterized protein conserved in bacteria
MSKTTRQLVLFGAPLFVGVLNIFHPVHFEPTGIYEDIHQVVSWWITLHILNLFGFALLGWAAYLLIGDRQGRAVTLAKILIAIFIPTYTGFDSIIGIGTGILVQYANGVPPDHLAILDPAINAFWTNNIATMLAIVGSVSWGFGMSLCAVALTEPKRRPVVFVLGLIAGAVTGWGFSASMFGTLPWWIAVFLVGGMCMFVTRRSGPASLLLLSGILFGTTHVLPYGPLGMACFVVAVALLESSQPKAQPGHKMETVPS